MNDRAEVVRVKTFGGGSFSSEHIKRRNGIVPK